MDVFVGTARIACGGLSTQLSGVRPSVRPSVRLSHPAAARRCCVPGGQEISIDCCTTGGQHIRAAIRREAANAGSAT